jgi:rSAM/selenodomain-associated transferase 2
MEFSRYLHVDIFVFYAPPERRQELEEEYPGPWFFVPQGTGHIGMRMAGAMDYVFKKGYTKAVLVGTDIRDLNERDVPAAFRALESAQVVLGPARDGGYYLVGLSIPFYELFLSDSWSHPHVYEHTVSLLSAHGLTFHRVALRGDVDAKEDADQMMRQEAFRIRLSIIIPFLGEPEQIAFPLRLLEKQMWPGDEIVLVRGNGERNGQVARAGKNTKIINAPRGRGLQLNEGVRHAQGELLWFLHMDSLPPTNFAYHLRKLARAPGYAMGCFTLGFLSSRPSLTLIAKWANFRTRHFSLPYGDQGIFCRKNTFLRAGGFARPFLMEDVAFVRTARVFGRIMLLPQIIYTSPKKYLRDGVLHTSCRNHLLMLLNVMGVSDRRLYQLYYGRWPEDR